MPELELPAGFPMTPLEVLDYRERTKPGHRTPFAPVEPDSEPWLCFGSRGTYEFFVHPARAAKLLAHGWVVGDKTLPVTLTSTPFYPWIGAVQICVKDDSVNVGYIDATQRLVA